MGCPKLYQPAHFHIACVLVMCCVIVIYIYVYMYSWPACVCTHLHCMCCANHTALYGPNYMGYVWCIVIGAYKHVFCNGFKTCAYVVHDFI